MKSRRLLFSSILLIYIVLCLLWMSFIPYDKKSLYRAVPPNASFISEHKMLSERWRDLSANQLVAALLKQGVDISPEVMEKFRSDPMAAKLFEKFAYKNTLVSYTKYLPGSGSPALVIATWAGSSGQIARWSGASGMLGAVLEQAGGIKLRKINYDKGRQAWGWDPPGNSTGYKCSAGFAEGVLVCCISPDSEAVCHVLQRILNHRSMGSILRKHYSVEIDDGYYDRGWVRLPDVPNPISFVFKGDAAARLEGWVRVSEDVMGLDLNETADIKKGLQASGLNSIIGDEPGIFCSFPLAGAESVVSDETKGVYKMLSTMASKDALIFSALLGGEFSGHLFVRVPTLILGVQVPKNTSLPDSNVVSGILDDVNKQIQTAFIPVYEEYNGKQMLVIGGTADDFYGRLKHKDKSVLAVLDDWLVYSSNKGVMKKLIDGDARSNTDPQWLMSAPAEEFAGYGWMDLDSADSALESGIVAYSLMLSLGGGSGSRSTRRTLDAVRGGLKMIAPMQSCRIMLKQQDTVAEIGFVLGK